MTPDLAAQIRARLAELHAERDQAAQQMAAAARQQLLPYDAAIGELERLLPKEAPDGLHPDDPDHPGE